jgi:hypothetical protein
MSDEHAVLNWGKGVQLLEEARGDGTRAFPFSG